jgi:hypothetical protein
MTTEADADLYRWVKSKEFRRLLGEGIPKYLSDPAFGLTELAEHIKVPIQAVNWLIGGLLDEIRRRDRNTRKTIAAGAARMARPTRADPR